MAKKNMNAKRSSSTMKIHVGGETLHPNSRNAGQAKGHLGLLKKKIHQDSTFGAKLHDRSNRFDRDAMSSRISGRNRSTYGSPEDHNGKAVGINSPNYVEQKKKVYGQYHASPGNRAKTDNPEYHKTSRQKATYSNDTMTEAPPSNFKLTPCSICGRNFSQSKKFLLFVTYFVEIFHNRKFNSLDNIARHEALCKKNSQKKTKVFNSKKQRVNIVGQDDEDGPQTWMEKQKKNK